QFVSGRVERFQTDKGRIIRWIRDDVGRVVRVVEDGIESPALVLEWTEGRVSRIVVDRADLVFAWRYDTLASISWQVRDRVEHSYACVQRKDSLAIVTPTFDTHRFMWHPQTGIVRGDGFHSYELVSRTSGGGAPEAQRLVMRSPDGSTASYILGSPYG